MNLEDNVREALVAELQRQLCPPDGHFHHNAEESVAEVRGRLDLDALSMAVVGALAGGP